MNRLNKLLFAGTLVPAIALTPVSTVFAQAPDQERGAPGSRPSGMSHGAGDMRQHGGGAMTHEDRAHAGGAGAATHAAGPGSMERQKSADAPAHAPSAPEAQTRRAAETGGTQDKGPEDHKSRAAESAHAPAAAERPTRDATDIDSHKRHNGMTGQSQRTGTPAAPATSRDAAAPPAMSRPDNAARDDRRGTQDGNVAKGDQHGAPDSNATRDDHRTAPTTAAQDDRHHAPDTATDRGMPAAGQRDRHDDAQRDAPDRGPRDADRRDHGGTGAAIAIGAAAGFAGGFLAATGAQRLDDIRRDRRETTEDGRTYIREPGRTIVEDGGRTFVVHDENDRFRDLGYNVRRERRGNDYEDVIDRPGGVQIITYTDADGRMLRRVRRDRDGREVVLIDNGVGGRIRAYEDDVVDLPPPPMHLARDRYVVDYQDADEGLIYDTLVAPPLARPPQRYTLDQIRYSPDVRNYVRSVDINTINFDTASWTVPGAATGKLEALASAIKRAVDRNPNSVFLVEGYTDAVGNPTDNLSLSDRRAQSVAAILSKSFNVPPENLTTQGYGQQNPRVNTSGPSAENRRVVVRNITQLLASGDRAPPQE